MLLSYINIHKAFYHQGHELLSVDTERDFNAITSQVNNTYQNKNQDIYIYEQEIFLVNKNA